MKYSAKNPYPSIETYVSFFGVIIALGILVVTSLLFITNSLIQQATDGVKLSVIFASLAMALIGAALIGYCKIDNFKRGVWLSFGATAMQSELHKKYSYGRILFVIGSVVCGLVLTSLFNQ